MYEKREKDHIQKLFQKKNKKSNTSKSKPKKSASEEVSNLDKYAIVKLASPNEKFTIKSSLFSKNGVEDSKNGIHYELVNTTSTPIENDKTKETIELFNISQNLPHSQSDKSVIKIIYEGKENDNHETERTPAKENSNDVTELISTNPNLLDDNRASKNIAEEFKIRINLN